jgi:hypothetical protein
MLGDLTLSSPSRTYVAICVNTDGGHSVRRFALPKEIANDAQAASWFFLNRIDSAAEIKGFSTTEDFGNAPEISQESSSTTGFADNFSTKVRNVIAGFLRQAGKKKHHLYAPIPQGFRKRPRVKTPSTMPTAR